MISNDEFKNFLNESLRKIKNFLRKTWNLIIKNFEQVKNYKIKKSIFILFLIPYSTILLLVGEGFNFIDWVSNTLSLINLEQLVLIVAILAVFYQIKQFRKEGHHKFMDTLDRWLLNFQVLFNNNREHVGWSNFAVSFINQADRICYFALKNLIKVELVKYFKDQITSAYAIAFKPDCYLGNHYNDVNISKIRKNAINIKIWCNNSSWDFGDELLPDDRKL